MFSRMGSNPGTLIGLLTLAVCVVMLVPALSGAAVMPDWTILQGVDSAGGIRGPVDAAVADDGTVYVVEARRGRIVRFDRNGAPLGAFRVPSPSAVALTAAGSVLVSSLADGLIREYSASGAELGALDPAGLKRPVSLAVGPDGRIYAADPLAGVVAVFSADGTHVADISGTPSESFRSPTGVGVAASGLVYIAERAGEALGDTGDPDVGQSMLPVVRVHIFAPDGAGGYVHQGMFAQFGTGDGNIHTPTDVAVDGAGRVYVGDNWQRCIHVFGADGTSLGTIADPNDPMGNVVGLGFGNDRIVSASQKDDRVFEIGIDGWVDLSVNPGSVSFTVKAGKAAPAPASVSVENNGPGVMDWTAVTSESWITLGSAGGSVAGVGSEALEIGVDPAGLAGNTTYTGTVTVSDGRGPEVTVAVTLVLEPEPSLVVDPAKLQFVMEAGGANPGAQLFNVVIQGDSVPFIVWNASASGSLPIALTTDTASGTVTVSVDGAGLAAGSTATGTVTVDAPGATPSSAEVLVELVVIDGTPTDPPAGTVGGDNIVAGQAPARRNGTNVAVLRADGTPEMSFDAFPGRRGGVHVAVGDVTGDGTDEIIAGLAGVRNNPAQVRVFDAAGALLGEAVVFGPDRRGVNVASGDFDGDGTVEIVVATDDGGNAVVRVLGFDSASGTFFDTGVNFEPFAVAAPVGLLAGDTDGDGAPEIATYPVGVRKGAVAVRVWDVDTTAGIPAWVVAPAGNVQPAGMGIAAVGLCPDLNGDGALEAIAVGIGGRAMVLDAVNGSILNVISTVIGPGERIGPRAVPTVSAADIDGDGSVEVLVGLGGDRRNGPVINVVDLATDTIEQVIHAFSDGHGAGAAVGNLGF